VTRASLLSRGEAGLEWLLRFAVGAMMIAAVTINCANVIARYAFARPFIWAEETMQFLNVWTVMLGAAVITRGAGHLRMDALYFLVSPRVRRALDAFTSAVAIVVVVYVVVQASEMVRMLTNTGQRSVIAGVPMNLMYLAVLVGFACSALFLLVGAVRRAFRKGRGEEPA
jgi:C4-dicarboxylate transporter DctQ subunit